MGPGGDVGQVTDGEALAQGLQSGAVAACRGKTDAEAATLAARFVERVITATRESTPFGIAFEPELGWLLEQL
jgi:hypothetical protein